MPCTDALLEFVEKTALLRETIKRRGDEEHYAARVERMSQKLEALAKLKFVRYVSPQMLK